MTLQSTASSQNTNTVNQTQTTSPWATLEPYLADIFGQAQTAYNTYDRSAYEGSLYASPTSAQQQALEQQKQLAGVLSNQLGLNSVLAGGDLYSGVPTVSGGVGLVGMEELQNLALSQLAGDYLYSESNPYLQSAINMAQRSLTDNFTSQVLPQMSSQAVLSGAYGGSRQGIMESLASQNLMQEMSDIATQMAYENYTNERTIQQGSGDLLTQAQEMEARKASADRAAAAQNAAARAQRLQEIMTPLNMLSAAGEQEQAWAQAALDADLQKYLMNQELTSPLTGLSDYASVLGLGTGYGTANTQGTTTTDQTQTSTPTQASTASNVLSGALGGASTAASIGSLLAPAGATGLAAIGGPWTLAAGGILGALGGLFG